MTQIINTKFLCKSTTSRSSGRSTEIHEPKLFEIVTFERGKWYDGEYETWGWEDGYRCNDGWRRYWVVNEQGEKEQINRSWFKVMFECDIENIRDEKINEVLKND